MTLARGALISIILSKALTVSATVAAAKGSETLTLSKHSFLYSHFRFLSYMPSLGGFQTRFHLLPEESAPNHH